MRSKALIGRQSIMDYLGVGRDRFRELVAAGLPVEKRGDKRPVFVGHPDQIDAWFMVASNGKI